MLTTTSASACDKPVRTKRDEDLFDKLMELSL
jgi:hypothetical protein